MDRLDAIRLFIRVIERGSFSAAAREAGTGQSVVSKQIAALEAQLGAQLLLRTSRSLRMTETGQRFYESALRLVDDYAALEALARQGQSAPSGLVRIAVAPVFGRLYIVPNLPDFFERFPGIRVEMFVSDRYVNMIEEGIDLAVRHGDLADSAMTARRLATSPFVTVATPIYLERHGIPAAPADLARHACIVFTGREEIRPWSYRGGDGAKILHHPGGNFRTNDGEQIRAAVLSHLGIANLPAWLVMPELSSGALRTVLQDDEMETTAISAIYPSRRGLTTKVRILVDFLAETLARDLRGP
jgi:LysR family transcriptional regulator for bpeEF and oprC